MNPASITRVFPAAGPEFAGVASGRDYDRPCNQLLFSGQWITRKGITQVIEAFTVLGQRHPSMQLGVLGAGTARENVVAGFPEQLRSRIKVHPPLSHADCAQVLLDYDIFLLPSFAEGTPLALIEAMYTGIPVITTATCGMKDVIQNGQNGLLVGPGDAGQIIRSVEQLMADSELRRRLGQQAFSDATQKYTWRAAAEAVNAAYASILRPRAVR